MNFSFRHLLMLALLCIAGWFSASATSPTRAIDNKCFGLLLVDNISHYTTVGELNNYDNRLRLQNINLTKEDLNAGENVFKFYRTAENGTKHVFAELILNAAAAGTSVTVTPSIRYYDEDDNLTANGGNTSLNYTSRTYMGNDTIDLYGIINYVNDVFSEDVAENMHPASYTYYATFNEQGAEPQPEYTVGDILGSLDLNSLSNGTNTLSAPWGGTITKATTGPGSPYVQIGRNNSITFTIPEGVNDESVTVAITTINTNEGSGTFIINVTNYSATRNTTNYFVVQHMSGGGTITISTKDDNKPRINSTSTIYIYYGNFSGS